MAHPNWRASAVGVYRLWRDLGVAVSGLTAGLLADSFGLTSAMAAIGVLTFGSGVIVALVMYETLPPRRSATISVGLGEPKANISIQEETLNN